MLKSALVGTIVTSTKKCEQGEELVSNRSALFECVTAWVQHWIICRLSVPITPALPEFEGILIGHTGDPDLELPHNKSKHLPKLGNSAAAGNAVGD